MKKGVQSLLALLLAVLVLVGDLWLPERVGGAWAEQPQTAAQAGEGLREGTNAGNLLSQGGSLQAKSRKKKKNSTAAPAETATPAPKSDEKTAQQEDGQAASSGTQPGADSEARRSPTPTPLPEGPIIDPRSIADYLFAHDMQLPENFITKKEAQKLGWGSRFNYVSDVAPGKSIGGDYFGNYEGKLPTGKGITYHEADCYYTKGKRNAYRVIYSSDGRVWYTEDHYNTFEEILPNE